MLDPDRSPVGPCCADSGQESRGLIRCDLCGDREPTIRCQLCGEVLLFCFASIDVF